MNQNFLADQDRARAYALLLETVFGAAPLRTSFSDPLWEVLAYFGDDGSCLAGVEIGDLDLVLDGASGRAAAIRHAGVAPSHRGRGLFRSLMTDALRRADQSDRSRPTLLYTENEALYSGFGFSPLAQHVFVGKPPTAAKTAPARSLKRADANALIDRLAPTRAAVSRQCAVCGAVDLLKTNLDDEDLRLAFLDARDALVVYEVNEAELVVVDIVAATIPPMAEIVGALPSGTRRVRTLFPPDRLEWDATPERDDTGLMIRGAVPPAMLRPFMLPPTTSF